MTREAATLPLDRTTAAPPRGLSLSGALALCAIAAVLVVVSIPRLCGMAQQENEVDACATARQLASALRTYGEERAPTLSDLLRMPELVGLRADAELLEQGRLLRRHGYLFELSPLTPSVAFMAVPLTPFAAPAGSSAAHHAVRAWPWEHGSTGRASFMATDSGATLMHANAGAHCQGPRAAGESCIPLEGWTPVN
ncbi:MAG: hypothetical protein EXS08_05450 [Planctomycetes bacterium]|nr:hypothetical protein [Planctomycetota bacterium]